MYLRLFFVIIVLLLIISPGTLEFVENAIQTPTSYDEELNKQQYDQLPVDAHEILQLLMKQLGQPGTSNSIDEVNLLPVPGTEWPGNQMAAGFQPLTQQQFGQPAEISTADSLSTGTIGESEISEAERKRRERKRASDRAYRKREKEKKQKLQDDNQEKDQRMKTLDAEIERLKHESLKEQQLMKSAQLKLTKLEAEKELLMAENQSLNERLEDKSREMDQLLGKIEYTEQQIIITKPKEKLKKQVKMAETADETKNDMHSSHDKNDK
ncbi:hypothetical protein SLA2020_255340 [Shorea laevis]